MNIYAIGDIHGCFEELDILWSHLLNEENFDVENDKIVFIGDYIDRGTNSVRVIEKCIEIQKKCKHAVFLKGNHEDMFLSYLGLPGNYGDSFIQNGGLSTLRDYGLDPTCSRYDFPKSHIEFFKKLQRYHETEKYIFVHAGVKGSSSLENQRDDSLFWIRDEFYIRIKRDHGKFNNKIFIHGHTRNGFYFDLPYRINIDSGCFDDGALTCIKLNDVDVLNSKVMQVKRHSNYVTFL